MLVEEELQNVYQLELDLIPVLMDMRQRGIRVDLDKAEKVLQELLQKERDLVAEIKRITGVLITPSDSKTAGPALEAVGINCPITPKTRKPSVKKEWLESLEGEVPDLINRARTINKIHGTFITNSILNHHHHGRIHAELLSVKGEGGGTVGGRFSSRNPNMQQIPARDPELAPMIRDLFLPEEGELWCAADYSSQEPRFTVHFAVAVGAPGSRKIAEEYWSNPKTDYHSLVAEICGIARKPAKTINLGLAYGMGEAALCRKLGLPTKWTERSNGEVYEVAGEEGASIIARYHEAMPFLRTLDRIAKNKANSRGFVRTISGRKCRFKKVNGKSWGTHKSLNRIVQGSSADQTKRAMIELHRSGKPMLMSIHDEIDFSVPAQGTREYVREIEEVMTTCVPELNVPFIVDSEVGPTWGTARLLSLDED
jgi:DNA polymerase I-like protein with 3'-5' exonuclease and polymerase domains